MLELASRVEAEQGDETPVGLTAAQVAKLLAELDRMAGYKGTDGFALATAIVRRFTQGEPE